MITQKSALVTGAQQGIGAAIASVLIEANVNVVMNYLDDDREVSRLVDIATGKGIGAKALRGDVTNLEQAQMMVDAVDEFGETAKAITQQDDMQLSFFQLDDPVLEQIRDEIQDLDIDTLTPVEALLKLNEIKKLTGQ